MSNYQKIIINILQLFSYLDNQSKDALFSRNNCNFSTISNKNILNLIKKKDKIYIIDK